jgi:hypothetical protein
MVGLGVLASAALAVSGCGTKANDAGGGGGSAPAASSAPANPNDAVLASTKGLSQTTYTYTLSSDGLVGKGSADPAARKTSMTLKGTQAGVNLKMDFVLIGTDMWAKLDFGGAANTAMGIPATKYMHIDQSKLKDKAGLGFSTEGTDPAASANLLKGLVDAQRVDARHYTIKLDLTKTSSSSVNEKVLSKLGDKAKAVPGTVTLDDQGRLSEIDIDLSAVDPTASIKVVYADYGAPVTINAPAKADTIEAPKNVYDIFNS